MKYLLIFLPFLAFGQNCPDDFWKQAVLAGEQTIEIQLKKGQGYKPVIIERKDTTEVETWVLTKKTTTTPAPIIVEQVVDAADNVAGVTFSGSWNKGPTNASGWYKNSIAYSSSNGATVTYTFTGRKVEVYGETLQSHGTGTVKVDNEPEVPVTYKSATKVLPAKIFEKSWPTDGQHTIVVKVGTGNSLIDFFKSFRAQ